MGIYRLDVDNEIERSLLRMLCMGRVMTSDLAKLFETAFSMLPKAVSANLVKGLSTDGIDDGTAIILCYSPATFANALKTAHKFNGDDSKRVDILGAIMCFLSSVYEVKDPY